MRTWLAPQGVTAALALLSLLEAPSAAAQAWTAPKGEAYFSFAYQYVVAFDHLTDTGERLDRGTMRWTNLISDLNYAVTDRLTLRVGIPFVFSKYNGAFPHRPPGREALDNGEWNSTFADVRLEARFMAKTRGLVVTPFAAVGLPSHRYESLAHSSPGKNLKDFSMGVNLGRLLDPLVPSGYGQARLAYGIPEKPLGISHNRTNLDLELGYFITPSLAARVVGAWQWTHGGWSTRDYPPPTSPLFQYHDQLTRDNHFNLGVGASFAARPALDLFVAAFTTIRGENTVKSSGFAMGTTIGFSPARMFRKARERERGMPPPP